MKFNTRINHDGCRPDFQGVVPTDRVQVYMPPLGDGPGHIGPDSDQEITTDFPGFYWRFVKVPRPWWLSWKPAYVHRVCLQPSFRPIVQYEIVRPGQNSYEMLEDILVDPIACEVWEPKAGEKAGDDKS